MGKQMKQCLNENLTLFYTPNFPFVTKQVSSKKYRVTLGIGGNVGNVKKRFNQLFLMFQKDNRFDVISTSALLKNPPFGFVNQDDFINGIVIVQTNLSVNELFKTTQKLEYRFGRVRSFKDAPRTLDIDIIFYANKKINTKKLTIPHIAWHSRESVTIPLRRIGK